MARQKLATIKPVLAPIKAPKGAKAVGQTDNGTIIWERRVTNMKKVPQLGPDNEHVWQIDPRTGRKMYPRFVSRPDGTTVERFIQKQTRSGDVYRVFNFEEKPEERARLKRMKDIKTMQEQLASALVDEGLSVDDLIRRLRAVNPGEAQDAVEPEAFVPAFPKKLNDGMWELSDGTVLEMSAQEALDLEASLQAVV